MSRTSNSKKDEPETSPEKPDHKLTTELRRLGDQWANLRDPLYHAAEQIEYLTDRAKHYEDAYYKSAFEVEQALGRALGYPWYKDDPANFPDATEEDGVCVGEHVPESLADEAAGLLKKHQRFVELADRRIKMQDELDAAGTKRNKADTLRFDGASKEEQTQAEKDYEEASHEINELFARLDENWLEFQPLLEELKGIHARTRRSQDAGLQSDQAGTGEDDAGDVRGAPV